MTTQAIENAKKLMAMLRGADGVTVVEPPRGEERSLFDDVP